MFACSWQSREQYLAILHWLQVINFESPPSFLDFLQTPQNEPLAKAGPWIGVESLFSEADALIFLIFNKLGS